MFQGISDNVEPSALIRTSDTLQKRFNEAEKTQTTTATLGGISKGQVRWGEEERRNQLPHLKGDGVGVTYIKDLGKLGLIMDFFFFSLYYNSFFNLVFIFVSFVKIWWSLTNPITSTNLALQSLERKACRCQTQLGSGLSATGAEPAVRCLQKGGNKRNFSWKAEMGRVSSTQKVHRGTKVAVHFLFVIMCGERYF